MSKKVKFINPAAVIHSNTTELERLEELERDLTNVVDYLEYSLELSDKESDVLEEIQQRLWDLMARKGQEMLDAHRQLCRG